MNYSRLIVIAILGFFPIIGHQSKPTGSHNHTDHLIAYCESLVSKNILGRENLKHLCECEHLINPITKHQADVSDESLIHYKNFELLIEKNHQNLIDLDQVKEWAANKAREIEAQKTVSNEIYEKTTDVHRPIEFVTIPAGTYVSAIDNSEFAIPEDIEIQATPMTQHQWLQLVVNNATDNPEQPYAPSRFNDDKESETITIGDTKYTILPDRPVESLSFDEITDRLSELTIKNRNYSYYLPSINEYEALLQTVLGKDWIARAISNPELWLDKDQTKSVASGPYLELDSHRVWDVIGHIWEFTRDWIEINNSEAHLVFGASYATKKDSLLTITSFLRPILYGDTRGSSVGFRLARTKNTAINGFESTIYNSNEIQWDDNVVQMDNQWQSHSLDNALMHIDDNMRYIFQNKNLYSTETQHTLDALIKSDTENDDPIHSLKSQIEIDLDNKQIRDISILSKLRIYLRAVILSNNQITDLTGLATLDDISYLDLNHNTITDIKSLDQLTSLEALVLDDNNIADVTSLGALTNLTSLSLINNSVRDIKPLSHLTQLDVLRLGKNDIWDISSLVNLTNLHHLELDGNHLEDIYPLSKLIDLWWLTLSYNRIRDITPISSMTNITTLILDNNDIHDLSSLSNHQNLETLFLKNNPLQDLRPLLRIPRLTTLELNNVKSKDIELICQLSNLHGLTLTNSNITDIRPFTSLTKLVALYLDDNAISDISSIVTLNLASLSLAHNNLTNIEPLRSLPNLQVLNLTGNPIQDISVLADLKNLRELYLDSEQINRLKPHNILKPDVNILNW